MNIYKRGIERLNEDAYRCCYFNSFHSNIPFEEIKNVLMNVQGVKKNRFLSVSLGKKISVKIRTYVL